MDKSSIEPEVFCHNYMIKQAWHNIREDVLKTVREWTIICYSWWIYFSRPKVPKHRKLLNKKQGWLKPLSDIPRKVKASSFSKHCFSETLDSSSGDFWLDLRVRSWRKHKNCCEKNTVDTVQRDRNFSGHVPSKNNCWLSFTIKWDIFFNGLKTCQDHWKTCSIPQAH